MKKQYKLELNHEHESPDESTSPLPIASKGTQHYCDVCGGDGQSWIIIGGIKWTVANVEFSHGRWVCRVCRSKPDHGEYAEPPSLFLAFPELQPANEEETPG